jgi:uncharacterized membrane-anchored protein
LNNSTDAALLFAENHDSFDVLTNVGKDFNVET